MLYSTDVFAEAAAYEKLISLNRDTPDGENYCIVYCSFRSEKKKPE